MGARVRRGVRGLRGGRCFSARDCWVREDAGMGMMGMLFGCSVGGNRHLVGGRSSGGTVQRFACAGTPAGFLSARRAPGVAGFLRQGVSHAFAQGRKFGDTVSDAFLKIEIKAQVRQLFLAAEHGLTVGSAAAIITTRWFGFHQMVRGCFGPEVIWLRGGVWEICLHGRVFGYFRPVRQSVSIGAPGV